jgi:Ca2+-binding RTX toxin-like protein
MAVATATTAINMSNWQFLGDTVYDAADGSHIVERDVVTGAVVTYSGEFTYTGPSLTGGTLNQVTQSVAGFQYNVTGLNHNVLTVNSFIVEQNEAGLFNFLFSGNDTFNGSSFADTLNGCGGNDKLNGKGGADKINGGAGNDIMFWGAGDTFNGGAGTLDTLRISSGNVDLTAAANPNSKLVGTEQIDLRTGVHTLTLNQSDVLDMTPVGQANQIKILGDGSDTVNIVGAQLTGGIVGNYTRYTIGSAVLLIDSDITVM